MKQFAVIGLGRFGFSLATSLYGMGHEVIGIDINEDRVEDIADEVTYAVQLDATDDDALKSIGIKNIDVVIVAIASDIQANILAALNSKELGIKTVYAKAMNDQHRKVLYKIGVDKVFLPERDMGKRVAQFLVSNNIMDLIQLDTEHTIMEISTLQSWENKNLRELNFRVKYGVNIIAIKREKSLHISPLAEDKILKNDILVVIGSNENLYKLNSKD